MSRALIRDPRGQQVQSRYETLVLSIIAKSTDPFETQAEIPGYAQLTGRRHRYDIIFRRRRLAVEVDGCWYHGCIRCFPDRTDWQVNASRKDREIDSATRKLGWKILRIKIHSLRVDPVRLVQRSLRRHGVRLNRPTGQLRASGRTNRCSS